MDEDGLDSGTFKVRVPLQLMELIPAYLKRRGQELRQLESLFLASDFGGIEIIARKLCNNAGTFGFHALALIGGRLESAATGRDVDTVRNTLRTLSKYLSKIVVIPT